MPTFSRGSFRIDLPLRPLVGDLEVEDRQLAWALCVELGSRVALRGKVDQRGEDRFRGEVLAESFDELDAYLEAARRLALAFPAGRVVGPRDHLGSFIQRLSELVVKPFAEKWQAEYRHWWEGNRQNGAPFVIQTNFPRIDELLDDWIALRRCCRSVTAELSATYGFVDVGAELTAQVQDAWG